MSHLVPPDPETSESPEARFRAVLEIARAIGSVMELDELLGVVMEITTALVHAERSTLYLIDRDRQEIWSRVLQGAGGVTEIRLPLGRGLAGFVADSGRTVNVKNAYDDPRFNAEVDRVSGFQTAAILTVPIRGKGGTVIGVAQALNKRDGGAFALDDERTLASLSALVGVALENAQLYAQIRAKNAELEVTHGKLRRKVAEVDLLFDIEREISSAPNLQAMLDAILDRALAATGADGGAVVLVEEALTEVYGRRSAGAKLQVLHLTGRVAGLPQRALESDHGVEGQPDEGSACALFGPAPRHVIAVPLIARSRDSAQHIGVLELADAATGPFGEEEMKLAALAGAQIARAVTLVRARLESERAGRLAVLGQTLGGIVHDLRSPMTVVSGYAELMARESDEAERERYSALILTQVDHVVAMTRDLLAFVRGERQLLARRVHVNEFWREQQESLTRELEPRGIRLELDVAFRGSARFDEGKLRRLITNLARNAAQAMGEGGLFRISCDADGDALVLRFSDSGPGIPPHVAARLFTAFNSHGNAGGTGLGLAIVKEVAEAHKGVVSFTTELGKGTTFTVRLPGAVVK